MADQRNWRDFTAPLHQWQRYSQWDRTLYDLCKAFPRHDDEAGVFAKVYLIGRSYQTGLERWAKANRDNQKGMDAVAEQFLDHRKPLDDAISELRALSKEHRQVPCADVLPQVCLAHQQLVRILKPVTRAESQLRSFAAKYLHFHAPIVPIYDAIAAGQITRRAMWEQLSAKKRSPRPATPPPHLAKKVDPKYWKYCGQLLHLAQHWPSDGTAGTPTARNLDIYLLSGSWNT